MIPEESMPDDRVEYIHQPYAVSGCYVLSRTLMSPRLNPRTRYG
jgi:hypothetical protein